MAFSVDPSHRPNGCFWPVISIPKGDDEAVLTDVHAVDQRATRSSDSSEAVVCAAVFATNRRLTVLLLIPRVRTSTGSGSRLRAYWHVATTGICFTTR